MQALPTNRRLFDRGFKLKYKPNRLLMSEPRYLRLPMKRLQQTRKETSRLVAKSFSSFDSISKELV